ncbi:hypothetical protein DPMN_174364 [Dreissena polymorpha]|uniref:Uncharacterized protein n=1 Tax=Dreissena polymorpha TaxID=45954 RepID=A0A9D4IF29_DREPO|nr:hypothetical protein DPMN_174364 [Dreissena polymorpha]
MTMEQKWLISSLVFFIELFAFVLVFIVDFLRYRKRKKLARVNSRRSPSGKNGDDVKCDVSETSEEIYNMRKPEKNRVRAFVVANKMYFMTHSMFMNGHCSDADLTTNVVETDKESKSQPDNGMQNSEEHIGPDGFGMHTVEVKSNGTHVDGPNNSIPINYECDPEQQNLIQNPNRNVQLPPIQPQRFSFTPEYDEWSFAQPASTRTTGRKSSGSKRNSFETHRVKIGMIGTLQHARNNRY